MCFAVKTLFLRSKRSNMLPRLAQKSRLLCAVRVGVDTAAGQLDKVADWKTFPVRSYKCIPLAKHPFMYVSEQNASGRMF